MKRVFLDTDAKNEIDDQFAIAYAVRHPELRVEGVGAAFFTRGRYEVDPDSMQASYDEAVLMLSLLGREDIAVHAGVRGRGTADSSDAARAIIALAHSGDAPLYVISLGAISNFALALQLDPSIAPKVRALFLDGDYPWGPALYNVPNDVDAFQYVLDSDVEYLHIPAPNVTIELSIGLDVARGLFAEGDRVGEYLVSIFAERMQRLGRDQFALWDVGAIAAAARPELAAVVTDGAPLYEWDPDGERCQRVTARPENPRRVDVVTKLDIDGVWDDYRRVMR